MVFVSALALAVLNSPAGDAAAADHDATGLLQGQSRSQKVSVAGRLQQALDEATKDSICLPVVAGEQAPIAGVFTADSKPEQVRAGQVAPVGGLFCVERNSFSLLQRSYGLNTASNIEVSLTTKQKKVAPAGYSELGGRCKPDNVQIGEELKRATFDQCQTACNSEATCVAFEFSPAFRECEIYSGVDFELSLGDKFPGPCSAYSCCYAKPPRAPTGYQTIAARCKPDANVISEDAGLTLAGCSEKCSAMADNACGGFEFETATGECESYSIINDTASRVDEDGDCNGESCCFSRIV